MKRLFVLRHMGERGEVILKRMAERLTCRCGSSRAHARAVGGHWEWEEHVGLVCYWCIAGTKVEKLIIVETTKNGTKQVSL